MLCKSDRSAQALVSSADNIHMEHSETPKNVRLVCGNCARTEYFASFDEASMIGWDSPHQYGYTACDRCPGVSVYFPMLTLQEARAESDPAKYQQLLEKAAAQTLDYDPARRANDS